MQRVTPLDFLEAIYLNEKPPLPTRMKAAIEAAPYVHPKLAMVANFNGGDQFAVALDRAIEASNRVREPKLIEAKATNGHLGPTPEEVSTKAMKRNFTSLRRRA